MTESRPSRLARLGGLVLFCLLLGACAGPGGTAPGAATAENAAASKEAQTPSKAQQELAGGIASYDNGNYKQAARQLQAALDLGLEGKTEVVSAHKYLAFIHCVSNRQRQCRDAFRKALEVDPEFQLLPAEAGHPIWGPVFRRVKAEQKNPKPAAKAPRSAAQ